MVPSSGLEVYKDWLLVHVGCIGFTVGFRGVPTLGDLEPQYFLIYPSPRIRKVTRGTPPPPRNPNTLSDLIRVGEGCELQSILPKYFLF